MLTKTRKLTGQASKFSHDRAPVTLRLPRIINPLAEKERALISKRTREALARAKARGTRLGNPRLWEARTVANNRNQTEADEFAHRVFPVIEEIRKTGAVTLRAVAEALNLRGVPTARGGRWEAQTVANVLRRAEGA